MREYRVYSFSSDNHIKGVPAVVICETDNDAIAEAQKLLDGLDIEVWNGARLVTRLKSVD